MRIEKREKKLPEGSDMHNPFSRLTWLDFERIKRNWNSCFSFIKPLQLEVAASYIRVHTISHGVTSAILKKHLQAIKVHVKFSPWIWRNLSYLVDFPNGISTLETLFSKCRIFLCAHTAPVFSSSHSICFFSPPHFISFHFVTT